MTGVIQELLPNNFIKLVRLGWRFKSSNDANNYNVGIKLKPGQTLQSVRHKQQTKLKNPHLQLGAGSESSITVSEIVL